MMTTDDRAGAPQSYVEVAAQTIGLLVVLTPVIGALMRWLAFSWDGNIGDPLGLAVSAPIQNLIATAVGLLWPALGILIFTSRGWPRPVEQANR